MNNGQSGTDFTKHEAGFTNQWTELTLPITELGTLHGLSQDSFFFFFKSHLEVLCDIIPWETRTNVWLPQIKSGRQAKVRITPKSSFVDQWVSLGYMGDGYLQKQKWFRQLYYQYPTQHGWQITKLETWFARHGLPAAPQVGGCPFMEVQLVRASSRQLGCLCFF